MCCSLHQITWEEEERLFRACRTGDLDTVKASQVALRDVRDHFNYEYSPLHYAAGLVLHDFM